MSFVQGVQVYKTIWEPGDLLLWYESDNAQDKLAVNVIKSGAVVEHAPQNTSPSFLPVSEAKL